MRGLTLALIPLLLSVAACESDSPSTPSATIATVRFAYLAATARNPNLPAAAVACAQAVGQTHIHPSWRNFARIDMQPIGADRWEISFNDVPVNVRHSIRVSDGNVCTENPTGAATRNVFANNVQLVQVVQTPGSGPTGLEPGLAFTIDAAGRVTP